MNDNNIIEFLRQNDYLASLSMDNNRYILTLPKQNNKKRKVDKVECIYEHLDDGIRIHEHGKKKKIKCPKYGTILYMMYDIIFKCHDLDYSYALVYKDGSVDFSKGIEDERRMVLSSILETIRHPSEFKDKDLIDNAKKLSIDDSLPIFYNLFKKGLKNEQL